MYMMNTEDWVRKGMRKKKKKSRPGLTTTAIGAVF